jgi:hypothetical protein
MWPDTTARQVAINALHQFDIKLHQMRFGLEQMTKARISRPNIINNNFNARLRQTPQFTA